MLRTLTALPPRPARFPPERGWACNDVSCYMPVGLSLRTEASSVCLRMLEHAYQNVSVRRASLSSTAFEPLRASRCCALLLAVLGRHVGGLFLELCCLVTGLPL